MLEQGVEFDYICSRSLPFRLLLMFLFVWCFVVMFVDYFYWHRVHLGWVCVIDKPFRFCPFGVFCDLHHDISLFDQIFRCRFVVCRTNVVVLVFYGPSTLFVSFRVRPVNLSTLFLDKTPMQFTSISPVTDNWTASSEFGTYRLCEQRRFRRACASAQSRQNLRCSLI